MLDATREHHVGTDRPRNRAVTTVPIALDTNALAGPIGHQIRAPRFDAPEWHQTSGGIRAAGGA